MVEALDQGWRKAQGLKRVTTEARDLFRRPRHPYTRALLDSIPKSGKREHGARLPTIPGIVPSLFDLPHGCRFQDRCELAEQRCVDVEPALETNEPARKVRCHFPLDVESRDLSVFVYRYDARCAPRDAARVVGLRRALGTRRPRSGS